MTKLIEKEGRARTSETIALTKRVIRGPLPWVFAMRSQLSCITISRNIRKKEMEK